MSKETVYTILIVIGIILFVCEVVKERRVIRLYQDLLDFQREQVNYLMRTTDKLLKKIQQWEDQHGVN